MSRKYDRLASWAQGGYYALMAKLRTNLTPEEGAELKRLRAKLLAADKRAKTILRAKGMTSPEFLAADKEVGAIVRKIKKIFGTTGKHWMAT
jgi:hypothetical protein